MIIQGHACTVYMNQNGKNTQNCELQNKFSFLKDRAKFMNLKSVLNYFKKNLKALTRIIKMID